MVVVSPVAQTRRDVKGHFLYGTPMTLVLLIVYSQSY